MLGAEAPLRQCVHSLVEKTWQELQPSWVTSLARQQPAQPAPMPLPMLLPMPSMMEGGEADGGAGGVNDATLMLAMLLAQGVTVPPPFMMPITSVPVLSKDASGSMPPDIPQQQQSGVLAPLPTPSVPPPLPSLSPPQLDLAHHQPVLKLEPAAEMTPEEAEAAARARVAALAPDPPPQQQEQPASPAPEPFPVPAQA